MRGKCLSRWREWQKRGRNGGALLSGGYGRVLRLGRFEVRGGGWIGLLCQEWWLGWG